MGKSLVRYLHKPFGPFLIFSDYLKNIMACRNMRDVDICLQHIVERENRIAHLPAVYIKDPDMHRVLSLLNYSQPGGG